MEKGAGELQIPAIVPAGNLDLTYQIPHPETGAPIEVRFPPDAVPGSQFLVTVPRAPVAAIDLGHRLNVNREPVTWFTSTMAVFGLRWRQILQKKRSLFATMIVPGALMLLSGWLQAN